MAEQIDGNAQNLAVAEQWTVVQVHADFFDDTLTYSRHGWLSDSSRNGRWISQLKFIDGSMDDFTIYYSIENPDVAMEFKIRFG